MSLLVVGSVAFDAVRTPHGKVDRMLGGSATYFSVAASYFTGSKEPLNLGAEWHHNRPTLRSSMAVWGMPHRNYPMWNLDRITETAVRLLELNRLVTDIIIGKRFPYKNAVEAYQFIDQYPEKTVKTLFDYPRE